MYKLNACTVYDENNNKIKSYGISFENEKIQDISINKEKIIKLVKKCNKLKISKLHIYDIVEDFLVDFEV